MATRQTTVSPAPALLPRGFFALCAVAPLILTPVLSTGFFAMMPHALGRDLAVNCIACLAIPLGNGWIYRSVMPPWIARCTGLGQRIAVHLAVTGLVTLAIALMLYPVIIEIIPDGPRVVTWLLRTVTFSWAFLVPALIIQELRSRAEAVERRLLEQHQAALRARLEALQARTNPHFLFNAINAIVGLIQEDPERAERTLERLADVLRYALLRSRLETVSLRDELAMIEDYLEIQRARFGARLGYTLDIEPGLDAIELPPLVLQPLVENAVLHGLSGRPQGGQLRIVARRRGGHLALRVDDDGPGLGGSSHEGSGTGLRDLAHRLALIYGDAASLVLEASPLGGVAVELAVPIRLTGQAPVGASSVAPGATAVAVP